MKSFCRYIILLASCSILFTVANAQVYDYGFYHPFFYHPFNDHQYHNNKNKDQYQTYSTNNGNHPFFLTINYAVSGPLGSLKNYTHEVSARGWNISGMYTISKNWSAGLTAGYADFYQKIQRQVYHASGSDISAVQTHTVQTIPIMAKGTYYFISKSMVHPYVSLAAGIDNIIYQKWWGEFEAQNNSWRPALSPELGLKIPFGKKAGSGMNLGVKYNYAFYSYSEISHFSSWEANAGIYLCLK